MTVTPPPFLLSSTETYADRAEGGCASRLRCPAKDIDACDDSEVDETGGYHRGFKLCFQQSAGDSPGPQGDVLLRVRGYLLPDENVTDLQSPVRLEDPGHFPKRSELVRHKI